MPKLDLSVRIEPLLGSLLGQRFWIPLSAPPSTWPLGSLPVSQAAHFVTEVLCVGQLFLSLSLFLLCQVKNHKLSITPGAEEGKEPVSSRPKSNVSAAAELCPDPEFASLTVVQPCFYLSYHNIKDKVRLSRKRGRRVPAVGWNFQRRLGCEERPRNPNRM